MEAHVERGKNKVTKMLKTEGIENNQVLQSRVLKKSHTI